MSNRTEIKTTKTIYPQIYAYTLPKVKEKDGWVKIGYTERKNVEERIKEQTNTAAIKLDYDLLWSEPAKFAGSNKWFKDTQFHAYLRKFKNVEQQKNTEWFFYNGNLEKSYVDFQDFKQQEINQAKQELDYQLREEQASAVNKTLAYIKDNPEGEFLWNAKPRFGKTLTTYDLARKMEAINVLIVTNRPAIANSWFDDFEKFIAWQTTYRFVSTSDSLKNRPVLTREEYLSQLTEDTRQIAFISLQDLKGSLYFGGKHDKLKWVRDLHWDLLVIDEAHEGVDTFKTDVAFNRINRNFTLHLSGTPFKALASGRFTEEQIYNWTYADEQAAKANWEAVEENNPYEKLPRLNLFTYEMSRMITDEVNKGAEIDGKNIDYAFDLNEFFATKDNGRFIYEEDVKKWLDTLTHNEKYPFSTKELRDKLKHTLWLLNRVASAKALQKLLQEHPVFENYEIILAAGDGRGIDDEETANEKALDRVRKAIKTHDKTITLSVGQLTTGVTVPEWTGVMMLSNLKSSSLYMQAAFRAQNPWEFEVDGQVYQKENAYVFDFAPERTLIIYDEFANNLSGKSTSGDGTTEERKDNIRNLLNFFPVIAEDNEGKMVELDVNQVLTIPKVIKAREVVKRGFMSNFLFQNISGIFASSDAREILEQLNPVDVGKTTPRKTDKPIDTKDVKVDEEGEVTVDHEIVITENDARFGDKVYQDVSESVENAIEKTTSNLPNIVAKSFTQSTQKSAQELAKQKGLTVRQAKQVVTQHSNVIAREVEMLQHETEIKHAEAKVEYEKKVAEAKNNFVEIEKAKSQFEAKTQEIENEFKQEVVKTVKDKTKELTQKTTETILKQAEEKKKNTVEDDVRARLRGFARTIPSFLMAYGEPTTTLATFDQNIDDEVFKEVTGITLEQFRTLRDTYNFFNQTVFDESVQEFLRKREELANYFNDSHEEDIFDYIPPQQTNQIYTPKNVVKMMIDKIEAENPEFFRDPNITFVDLYVKSGLYLTEIVKRLYVGLAEVIPDKDERLKHILENQVYGFAPTEIIYNIARNFVFGFDENAKKIDTTNIVCLDTVPFARGDAETSFEETCMELFGGKVMKFDVVVGNPPYQINDEGKRDDGSANASASPLYHYFFDLAKNIAEEKVNLIFPARWLTGAGKGLGDFRKRMLEDTHVKSLTLFRNSTKVFPNTDIKGGVLYLTYDKNYNGEADITVIDTDETVSKFSSYLNTGNLGVFIPYKELFSIYKKVAAKVDLPENNMQQIVSGRKPFGLTTDFFKNPKKYDLPPVHTMKQADDDIEIIGLERLKRVSRYVPKDYPIPSGEHLVDGWKVLVPYAYGSGEFGEVGPSLILAGPNQIATETFLVFGPFDTAFEAEAMIKYFKTKFFRALIGILKTTQHSTTTYRLIPKQDFSAENPAIDWTKTVKEIDQQLFAMYGLDDGEISFIQTKVQSME